MVSAPLSWDFWSIGQLIFRLEVFGLEVRDVPWVFPLVRGVPLGNIPLVFWVSHSHTKLYIRFLQRGLASNQVVWTMFPSWDPAWTGG